MVIKKFFLIPILALSALIVFGATPAFDDFESTQFATNSGKIAIKPNGALTNFQFYATGALVSNAPVIFNGSTFEISKFKYDAIPGLLIAITGEDLTNYTAGSAITNWPGLGTSTYAVTSTATAGPVLSYGRNGRPAAFFQGTNYLSFPTPLNLNTNSTIFISFEATNSWGLGNRYLIGGSGTHLVWGDDSLDGNRLRFWLNSASGLFDVYRHLSVGSPRSLYVTAPSVAGVLFERGSLTWPERANASLNNLQVPGTYTNNVLSWVSSGKTGIGALASQFGNATYGWRGWIMDVIVYTNAISTSNYKAITDYLIWKNDARDPGYLFCDGDAGFIGGAMGADEKEVTPVFHQINKMLMPHTASINASTVRTLANIETATTNFISGSLSQVNYPQREQVYLLYFGTQDFQTNLASVTWPRISNCLATARSMGWKAPAITLLPSGGTNDTERITYNDLIRRWWPSCSSGLIDLQVLANTKPGDYTNTTYYRSDTVMGYMPTSWMSQIVAGFIVQQLGVMGVSTNLLQR